MKKIIFIIAAVFAVYFIYSALCPAEIIINDETVLLAKNIREAKKAVREVTENKTKNSPDAVLKAHITYRRTFKKASADTETLKKELNRYIKTEIPCIVILADNTPLCGFKTRDEAGIFLLKLKEKYTLPGCEEPEIKENITIDSGSVREEIYFKSPEDALKYVLEPKTKPVKITYTVKKGDTLSGIAHKYGAKVSEIESENPGLSTLKIGRKITLTGQAEEQPKITVITRKPFKDTEKVLPKTVRVSSKQIPFGKQKIISNGKAGLKECEGFVIFENGVKTKKEYTKEKYISQPVPKQIAQGI